jgi:hypothetical protein
MYVEGPEEPFFSEKLPESASPGTFLDTQKPLPPRYNKNHGKPEMPPHHYRRKLRKNPISPKAFQKAGKRDSNSKKPRHQ